MSKSTPKAGVAVITGAASGIGAGLARHASARGMAVVLADWDEDGLKAVATSLSGEVVTQKADVRDAEQIEALAELAYSTFGQVDLLFNNAGVLSSGLSWEIEVDVWERSFDINVLGVVYGIRAFVPRMIAAERPARIVNTASVGGFFTGPLIAPYSASKAAVVSITEALVQELALTASEVSASVLAPGPVKTQIMREDAGTGSERLVDNMRRLAGEHGADPDAYAALIFEGVDAGEFWIVPQPDSLDERLQKRTQMILDRKSPAAPKEKE